MVRQLIVLAVLLACVACTAQKNVSVSTPRIDPITQPPSPTAPAVKCSSLPVSIPDQEEEGAQLTCASSASGDLDGDAQIDQFALYMRADSASQVDRLVGVAQLADRREVRNLELDPRAIPGVQNARVLGLVDANGDGRDEAFFTMDGGAAIGTISIATLQGTRLVQVRAGSRPAMFFFGGTELRGSGIECGGEGRSRSLIIRSAAATGDGQSFATSETEYRWSSGSASLNYRSRRTGSIPANAPDLKSHWRLSCGKLQIGG